MSDIVDRLYTAEQVRRLDACAIEGRGIPGYTLMCRAGQALFEAARRRFPEARHWRVLCGGGNNGGDGYVVARLALGAGLDVEVLAVKDVSGLQGDAACAAADWLQADGVVRPWTGTLDGPCDLVIDALLGTGLDRAVAGSYRDAVAWINAAGRPVVAVDIPSGLHADTGCAMGAAVRADLTVSFIGQKRGLFTADGPDHAGETLFDDLATPPDIHFTIPNCGKLLRESALQRLPPARLRNSHKGHYGHVLVLGGQPGMSGAARLAGEAALRSGAGLVSVATHRAHAAFLNLARPELMVSAVDSAVDLDPLLERSTVLALGPGLGQGAWGRMLLGAALAGAQPLVVDADGLNLLAAEPLRRERWILTPHPAEAARLLECDTGAVQADRVESALRIAERFGAVVVLKGCGSVVAAPGGEYAVCALGNPGMATAGSGDVLTGIVAALLGQGLAPWDAACAGVVLHAAAGDRVAGRQGERGLLAGDLVDALPAVLNG